MRAVVVYESMYGNTHSIADAIGDGLRGAAEVVVVPVKDANSALADGADLLVVGGPTHVHGMSRAGTRKAAMDAANKSGSGLSLDAGAGLFGLRDWFESLGTIATPAAAFDTRIDAPVALTGRASKGIGRMLSQHGCPLVDCPESFFVTKDAHLEPHQEARARQWGASLVAHFAPGAAKSALAPLR